MADNPISDNRGGFSPARRSGDTPHSFYFCHRDIDFKKLSRFLLLAVVFLHDFVMQNHKGRNRTCKHAVYSSTILAYG